MKTIGQFLKHARLQHKMDLKALAIETKIRQDYLEAIERNQFQKLPSAAFVKGFIQTYARAVGLEPETALAVFRRDFDQNQQGRIVPRGMEEPIHRPSRVWTPKTTTAVLAGILAICVAGYSIRQLVNLNAAPEINLVSPSEESVSSSSVEVEGSTSSDATVTINGQPVATDLNGNFTTILELDQGNHSIIIESTSRDGKTRTMTKNITVE